MAQANTSPILDQSIFYRNNGCVHSAIIRTKPCFIKPESLLAQEFLELASKPATVVRLYQQTGRDGGSKTADDFEAVSNILNLDFESGKTARHKKNAGGEKTRCLM